MLLNKISIYEQVFLKFYSLCASTGMRKTLLIKGLKLKIPNIWPFQRKDLEPFLVKVLRIYKPLCFKSGLIILILLSSDVNVVASFFLSDVFRWPSLLLSLMTSESSSESESSLSSNSSGLIFKGSGSLRFLEIGAF